MNRHHLGIGMTSQRTRERLVQRLVENGIKDSRVLDVISQLPRHIFIDEALATRAYEDTALPIGDGQTISQPYIVALMTEMLEVKPEHKVLEVGTGSGYQAAILSGIVKDVYSVEVIKALGEQASERLEKLNYDNIHLKTGDGYYGWEEHAPFDRIIVTCASTLVPPPLLKQLKPGGKMCIPVGDQYSVQYLTMVEKSESGNISMRKELPVSFVPLTRTVR